MERSIRNVRKTDKIKNVKIRKKTKTKDTVTTVRKLKIRCAGHAARRSEDEQAKRSTEWTPYGQVGKRSRPVMRWSDDIVRRLGILWMRSAQDRIL
mgnify:CR=1 FL=1